MTVLHTVGYNYMWQMISSNIPRFNYSFFLKRCVLSVTTVPVKINDIYCTILGAGFEAPSGAKHAKNWFNEQNTERIQGIVFELFIGQIESKMQILNQENTPWQNDFFLI